MISYEWALYGVRLTRKDSSHFLASAADSPVALFFMRDSAVAFARSLEAHGFTGAVPVRVHAKIDQVRRPSRRGVRERPS